MRQLPSCLAQLSFSRDTQRFMVPYISARRVWARVCIARLVLGICLAVLVVVVLISRVIIIAVAAGTASFRVVTLTVHEMT